MDQRLPRRTLTLLLIFTVLGVYYPAIFAPLNTIDDPGLYQYLLNTNSFSFHDIFVPGGSGTYYRPLLTVSFLADKYVWGLEESFMHLENVLFHLGNTLLVYAVAFRLSRLLKVASPLPALLAALFFAIHPLNTESVVWISGRTDLLAGMFVLLSMFFLLAEKRTTITSLLAAFSLLIACLAKDTAIFFLPAAFIFPFYCMDGGSPGLNGVFQTVRNNLSHFAVFTAAGAGYFAFRELAFSRGDLGAKQVLTHVAGSQGSGLLLSLRLVLKAAGFYVKKLFLPWPLNFGIIHVSDYYIVVGVLLFVVVITLLVRRTLVGFFFLAAASIGSSALLVPLLKMTWTPIAERYMYMPAAFFVVGITFVLYRGAGRWYSSKFMVPAVACLAAVAIYATSQRAILWQSNLALYEDCLRQSPDFIPAQNEIANALYARGDVRKACEIVSSMTPPADFVNGQYVYLSKAVALANSGDIKGARRLLMQALKNPGKHEVAIIQHLLQLNDTELLKGDDDRRTLYPQNVKLLDRLYQLTGDPFCQYRLGQTYLFMGKREKARDALQIVIAKSSSQAYYYPAAKKLLEKLSH